MENERKTKEIKTSSGHTLVIYTYATGGEFQQIQECYFAGAKINVVGGEPTIEGFDPKADFEANKKTFTLLIISVDGVSENVADAVLNLPVEDYNEVVEALGDISGKKKLTEQSDQQ